MRRIPLRGLSGGVLAGAAAYDAGLHSYPHLTQAIAIAWAESRWTLAYNGTCCYGAWQVNVEAWPASASLLLRSWPYNAAWMYRISRGGTNWGPWLGDPEMGCVASGDCIADAYVDARRILRLAG